MVWHDDEIIITHSFHIGRSKGHATQHSGSRARWPVVVDVVASTDAEAPPSAPLSEYEMDELRNMRVETDDGYFTAI